MAGGNWEQDGWWNKPIGQQGEQAEPAPEKGPSPVELVRQIANEQYATNTQQYATWAAQRQAELQKHSEAWVQDKDLAPYYDLARDEFYSLDQMFGQAKPVAEVVDMVKRKVLGWKQSGILPPVKSTPKPGFAPLQSGYDQIAGGPDRPNIGMFKPVDPVEKARANQEYLLQRRIDQDKRKFRGDEGDLKKLEELRKKQFENIEIG